MAWVMVSRLAPGSAEERNPRSRCCPTPDPRRRQWTPASFCSWVPTSSRSAQAVVPWILLHPFRCAHGHLPPPNQWQASESGPALPSPRARRTGRPTRQSPALRLQPHPTRTIGQIGLMTTGGHHWNLMVHICGYSAHPLISRARRNAVPTGIPGLPVTSWQRVPIRTGDAIEIVNHLPVSKC